MPEVKSKLIEWLQGELSNLPKNITAVYVEHTEAHAAATTVCFYMIGFETLADGKYDPENPDHAYLLGDFTWEGKFGPELAPAVSKDWQKSLRSAVKAAAVQKLIKARPLQFVVAEHDGIPEVINL